MQLLAAYRHGAIGRLREIVWAFECMVIHGASLEGVPAYLFETTAGTAAPGFLITVCPAVLATDRKDFTRQDCVIVYVIGAASSQQSACAEQEHCIE